MSFNNILSCNALITSLFPVHKTILWISEPGSQVLRKFQKLSFKIVGFPSTASTLFRNYRNGLNDENVKISCDISVFISELLSISDPLCQKYTFNVQEII